MALSKALLSSLFSHLQSGNRVVKGEGMHLALRSVGMKKWQLVVGAARTKGLKHEMT